MAQDELPVLQPAILLWMGDEWVAE
jgi:hypothetical protein